MGLLMFAVVLWSCGGRESVILLLLIRRVVLWTALLLLLLVNVARNEEVFRHIGVFVTFFGHFVNLLDEFFVLSCLPFLNCLTKLRQKDLEIGHIFDLIRKIFLELQ